MLCLHYKTNYNTYNIPQKCILLEETGLFTLKYIEHFNHCAEPPDKTRGRPRASREKTILRFCNIQNARAGGWV